MNTKKIPYNLALILLTTGASLILGLLSFSGMFALIPVLPFAIATLVLSVAYEAEIYLQNIKGALAKLFKYNYVQNQLAKEFLLEHFPKDINHPDCPPFFVNYAALQLKLKKAPNKAEKKQIKKLLKEMEQQFALQLFSDSESMPISDDTNRLRIWLSQQNQAVWQADFHKRRRNFQIVAAFSSLSALFMGLGSTYLIMEAFSAIPWIAVIPFAYWPFMIVPMAVVAGAAYGLLTYNTVTDLISNDTITKWFTRVHSHFKEERFSLRNLFMASISALLVGLAIALTICTAGTWWTIATNARPLFDWMSKMPKFVMGGINPLITGLSALGFNIQNTGGTIEKLDESIYAEETDSSTNLYDSIKETWNDLWKNKNWLQVFNPFRIIKALTITPLRIMLFIGHLASIALTADRMPGIPQIWAALIAFISEGFEDAHYFIGRGHAGKNAGQQNAEDINTFTQKMLKKRLSEQGGHSHDLDIPAKILFALATPLDLLAAGWDSMAAWLIPVNKVEPQPVEPVAENPQPELNLALSENWQAEHTVALIEKHIQKHLNGVWFGTETAEKKKIELRALQQQIHRADAKDLDGILASAKASSAYNEHRLFAHKDEKTTTQIFVEELSQRVTLAS
ncbi:MAG: hypothetical protein P4L79_05150 [Legionella sp.]|uniref:hypothetical protein n=1 Tax=Legionella sp. TaxID=459 RepID=UPI0028486E28|nr:hypothetical protein [Legionella sp.]